MALTFLPTGGPLAPDTYTVTLRSAADGLRDTAGGLLDGDGDGTPGGHYIATFTVAASAARVVSVPDFARGPGQPVDLPATGAGLPIRLDDGAGVTSARLVLAYDPSLLVITAAAVGSALPSGADGRPRPVHARAGRPDADQPDPAGRRPRRPGPADGARARGRPVCGRAGASSCARWRSTAGRSRRSGDAGVHLVAYFGDATGNGSYSAADATRISRIAVGLDGGLAAYPRVDPVILADITGNGALERGRRDAGLAARGGPDAGRRSRRCRGAPAADGPRRPAVVPEPGKARVRRSGRSRRGAEPARLDAGADDLADTSASVHQGSPIGGESPAGRPTPASRGRRPGRVSARRWRPAGLISSSLSVPTQPRPRLRSLHAGRPPRVVGPGGTQAARRLGVSRWAFHRCGPGTGPGRCSSRPRRSASVGGSPLVVLPIPGSGPIPARPAAWTWPVVGPASGRRLLGSSC